jgi:predicted ATPase
VAIEAARTLLERERELAALSAALQDAERRRGRVLLIEAPAGLGKTALLSAASAAAADAGFLRLRSRANHLERDFAYGCVRQLFEPAVAAASEPERLFEGPLRCRAASSRRAAAPLSGSRRPTRGSRCCTASTGC